jgi:hypothetical protein
VLHALAGRAGRFRAEAEIILRIDHARIARVLEAGDADGHPLLVMDHIVRGVDGEHRRARLARLARHARRLRALVRGITGAPGSAIAPLVIGDDPGSLPRKARARALRRARCEMAM